MLLVRSDQGSFQIVETITVFILGVCLEPMRKKPARIAAQLGFPRSDPVLRSFFAVCIEIHVFLVGEVQPWKDTVQQGLHICPAEVRSEMLRRSQTQHVKQLMR